jgi:polysaccharide export outer membrane protein
MVALAIVATTFQVAVAAESSVRILKSDAGVTPTAGTASGRPSSTAIYSEEFGKTAREAVALRAGINEPAAKSAAATGSTSAAPTLAERSLARREAPPVETFVYVAPSANAAAVHDPPMTPVEHTPVIVESSACTTSEPAEVMIPHTTVCPYGPGQSGSPTICGVDCGRYGAPCNATWEDARRIPWALFGPGEYSGPARVEHVSKYYLRVNDLLTLTYIASRRKNSERYRIGIGDRLRVESSVDETLDREVEVQPDGEITLPDVGEVMAAGKTVQELREELLEAYKAHRRQPQVTVTPVATNAALQEIVKAVKSEIGSDGQAQDLRVTPEGTIQVPGLGSVFVQGLTLDELAMEIEARYEATYGAGLLVSPSLTERATSYVFVGGEVMTPGRYTLEGPTTVMQAITLAGGYENGGNVRQVVVFRRDENWCLKATIVDVHAPLYGKDPCTVNDIWLRDNDMVIVPKTRILCATDVIDLYFTRGAYAVFPVSFFANLSQASVVAVP